MWLGAPHGVEHHCHRSHTSPFAYLIVPLLSIPGHDDVLRALMALSARHRSAAEPASPHCPAWSKTAMTLRDGVIGSLRRRLANLASAPGGTWDNQILIMMMFLCLYEIVDNCDHRWVIHLRASQDIIRRSRQVRRTVPTRQDCLGELTFFTERFFAFQDVISRAACENSPLFGQEYWEDEGTRQQQQQSSLPSEIDSWMGCSTALVHTLCRITDLSRQKARRAISAAVLQDEAAALEQELERLPRKAAEGSLATSTSTGEGPADVCLAKSAELKRKAVLLYLYCVLYDATPLTPVVAKLVTDILQGTASLVQEGLTAGLSFPIFVAAVELDPLDDQIFRAPGATGSERRVSGRRLVLETLQSMANSSLSNIARTKAIIEKVWRMRDMALDSEESCRLTKAANDWGIYVGPYSSNISLA